MLGAVVLVVGFSICSWVSCDNICNKREWDQLIATKSAALYTATRLTTSSHLYTSLYIVCNVTNGRECTVLEINARMLDAGCWMLDAERWMSDAERWILDAERWILDADRFLAYGPLYFSGVCVCVFLSVS